MWSLTENSFAAVLSHGKGAHTFDGHLAYQPHWSRIPISMPIDLWEGDPALLHFKFFIVKDMSKKGIRHLLCPISRLLEQTFSLWPLRRQPAVSLVTPLTSVFGPGGFFMATSLGVWGGGGPLSHPDSRDGKMNTSTFILLSLVLRPRTEPHLSTGNQFDNVPLNCLPSALIPHFPKPTTHMQAIVSMNLRKPG